MIATTERPPASDIRTALIAVFTAYNTHPLPLAMPATPTEWARDCRAAAEELRIPSDLDTADALVGEFLNGVLQTPLAESGTPSVAGDATLRETLREPQRNNLSLVSNGAPSPGLYPRCLLRAWAPQLNPQLSNSCLLPLRVSCRITPKHLPRFIQDVAGTMPCPFSAKRQPMSPPA